MGTIQSAMLLYHQIETALKKAMADKQPVSIRDLYAVPDIRANARNEQHVRDVVRTMADTNNKLALSLPLQDASGDKRARIGYMWNEKVPLEEGRVKIEKLATKSRTPRAKPETMPVVVSQQPEQFPVPTATVAKTPQDVEVVYGDVVIVIGKNEKTGAMRISIQVE